MEWTPWQGRDNGEVMTEHPIEDESPPADAQQTDENRMRKGLEQLLPDVVKRAVYAGLGAVFTTEEGIRKIASELHLPRDVASYLLQQAASSKDEVLRIIARELRGFLETISVSQELQKLLTSLSFEIKTEIRFIPNDEAISGVKPDIKKDVAVKRAKREE